MMTIVVRAAVTIAGSAVADVVAAAVVGGVGVAMGVAVGVGGQRAELPALRASRSFAQDAAFLLGGELPPLCLGGHFGRRPSGRQGHHGRHRSCQSRPTRLRH
jgi:hypothetical protein